MNWNKSNIEKVNITSVYMEGNKAVAIDINGYIYYSENYGNTWIISYIPKEDLFNQAGFIFLNKSHAIAGGSINQSSVLYNSHDSGKTWRPSNFPVYRGSSANNVSSLFLDGRNALCGITNGGNQVIIYFSLDHGINWERSLINGINLGEITSVFLEKNNAIAAGNSGYKIVGDFSGTASIFYYSKDNGINWALSAVESPGLGYVKCVYMQGKHAIAGGNIGTNIFIPKFYYSNNHGENWYSSKIHGDRFGSISCIFLQYNNAIAGSLNGNILYSNDHGKNWYASYINSINVGTIKSIFLNGKYAIAGGSDKNNKAIILNSSDYGKSWEVETLYDVSSNTSINEINSVFINGCNSIAGGPALYYSSYLKNINRF